MQSVGAEVQSCASEVQSRCWCRYRGGSAEEVVQRRCYRGGSGGVGVGHVGVGVGVGVEGRCRGVQRGRGAEGEVAQRRCCRRAEEVLQRCREVQGGAEEVQRRCKGAKVQRW